MTEVEKIARGLTEAQKRCLCGEMRDISNPPVWFLCGDDARDRRYIPTITSLTKKGLLCNGRFGPTMFTPIGLAVRQYLQEQSQ